LQGRAAEPKRNFRKKTEIPNPSGGDEMRRSITLWTAAVMASSLTPAVRAEHAKISLEVATSRENVTAFVDQTPPESGKNPRPVIRAKVNEPIRIKYLFTNVYPHKTLENVVVHFYVARQQKVGQKELPDLKGDVVIETAFDMDFKPGTKAGQRSTVKIDTPGVYLIRLETRNTQSDHEHFSAIDLVVGNDAKTEAAQKAPSQ
jgi:hypothetical protein